MTLWCCCTTHIDDAAEDVPSKIDAQMDASEALPSLLEHNCANQSGVNKDAKAASASGLAQPLLFDSSPSPPNCSATIAKAGVEPVETRDPMIRSEAMDASAECCVEGSADDHGNAAGRAHGLETSGSILEEATQQGRYVCAYKKLVEMNENGGNPHEVLDKSSVERIHRIGEKFVEAKRLFEMAPTSFKINEENQRLKLQWGMKIEGSNLQVVSTSDFDGDFLKMVVLDLERDLEDQVTEDDVRAEVLGEVHAHDASWRKRMVSKSVGTKADDILVVNSIDALDEVDRAICSLRYTIDPSATTTPSGVPVPSLEASHLRTPKYFAATKFMLLTTPDGKPYGVRKFEAVEVKLAPTVAKILGVMPGFMLKKLVRGNLEATAKMTANILQTSDELSKRMGQQPRADFYEHVRRRVYNKPAC